MPKHRPTIKLTFELYADEGGFVAECSAINGSLAYEELGPDALYRVAATVAQIISEKLKKAA